ncbi:MAG TPA: FG-GAP repeat protein, partial [Polyangiales bacterium]|nr:FG-GAP repeat protein [Polyangiales bacterium]
MTRVRALACACACALLACKSATPATQVMVLIDSESELRSQIASVDLEVKSGRGDESHWTTRLQRTVTPGKGKVAWPIELSLLPGESGARGNYSVRAVAKSAQGAALGQVRAISGYVAHRTLALVLRFDAACFARSTPCASDRTCSAGECLDSHVAADLLPPFERDANGKPVLVPFGTPELDGGVAPDAEASDAATGTTGAIDAAVLQSCGDTLCDELAGCTGSGASRQCAACPAGFVGDAASGCVPTLLDLAVTGGTLTPKLSADVTQYAIAVPLLSSHVTLTPSVPNGATLDIDGALLESDSWSTPALPLGERNVALRVDYPAHPGRRYALAVTRSGEQEAFLKAKQTVGDDWFGSALAISGDTLVVGAEYEDSGATGVNGNADDESVMDSGAAYVFERKNGVFELTAYLKADTAEAGALFGSGVAIDGDTILVGAEHASKRGAVYVFVRSG